MYKVVVVLVSLLMSFNVHSATPIKLIHIDERSKNRTICHLEFAVVIGLTVDAKLAAPDAYHSRVNNERYAACPYDLEIGYGGQLMRVDFGTGFDLESVTTYRHSSPVDSGFFIYDGRNWRGQDDILSSPLTEIHVAEESNSQLVSGLLRRVNLSSKARDFCYAFTLVYGTGYATGGVCAAKAARLKSWQDLFLRKAIITYKP